eukprot:2319969-Amphidinium_carterae.1
MVRHDRTGRMEAVGVIRKGLEWKSSREFFYNRVKRRLHEKAGPPSSQAAGKACRGNPRQGEHS